VADGAVGRVHQRLESFNELDYFLSARVGPAVLLVGRVVDDGAGRVVSRQVGLDRGGEDGGLTAGAGAARDVQLVRRAGLAAVAGGRDPREDFADGEEDPGGKFDVAVQAVADFADQFLGEVKGGGGQEVAALGMSEEVPTCVDDREAGTLGVAARDDGAGARLRIGVAHHVIVEGAELLAAGDPLIAEGTAKFEWI